MSYTSIGTFIASGISDCVRQNEQDEKVNRFGNSMQGNRSMSCHSILTRTDTNARRWSHVSRLEKTKLMLTGGKMVGNIFIVKRMMLCMLPAPTGPVFISSQAITEAKFEVALAYK
ncbi:hypothetical protein CHS0354_004926 [Potamilus streckersoni]|uniref:Uncharacterized protein n=1 Tax=Potamilus streckersoni TaxID=2493646 RepID=A0AAE0TJ33_9BIVA|nr:hypothetical protein CHS0354_004926 [Potamilus streckersoni]